MSPGGSSEELQGEAGVVRMGRERLAPVAVVWSVAGFLSVFRKINGAGRDEEAGMTDMIDELTHAEHASQLGLLGTHLNGRGITSELIDPGPELPVTTLMVGLAVDDEGRERTLAVSIMPLGDDLESLQLVQFYVQMPFGVSGKNRAMIERATATVNGAVAFGNFGMHNDQLFYRHVHAMPVDQVFEEDTSVELVGILAFHQEYFGDYFEGLLNDDFPLSSLASVLAET
jgi:hypothetical protein